MVSPINGRQNFFDLSCHTHGRQASNCDMIANPSIIRLFSGYTAQVQLMTFPHERHNLCHPRHHADDLPFATI